VPVDAPAVAGRGAGGWEGLFWNAFRNSASAMVLLDEQRRLMDLNEAYVRLLGYPRAALLGRFVYEFIEGGPTVSTREWLSLLEQRDFTGVVTLQRADGIGVVVEAAGHREIVTGEQRVLFVVEAVAGRARQTNSRGSPAGGPLSRREIDVTRLIALGHTGPEIAEALYIAPHTVRTHARNAMAKVGARSRAHLVAKTLGDGLLWDPRRTVT
jgi:PAS domain S-box-containing protein